MPESPDAESPDKAVVDSLGSDALDLTVGVADVGLDALITSGTLDGVPIVGLLSGIYKVSRHVPALLYQKKMVRFLAGLAEASPAERSAFVEKLREEGELQRFGEVVLLLVEKADEIEKPAIIGRIMAAHVQGKLTRQEATRLSSMVTRAFAADLEFLKGFRFGTGYQQRHIVASLAAVGALDDRGLDGGDIDASNPESGGGSMYALGGQGTALLRYGFGIDVDFDSQIAEAERAYHERHKVPDFLTV